MYPLIRNLLFQFPPEDAHRIALRSLSLGAQVPLLWPQMPSCPVQLMGLNFPNPVGLAAGLDKNGDYFNALGKIGFGFIEIGTITPRPQAGHPPPRLFRLPEARALINRLGFNNKGLHYMLDRLQQRSYRGILGINIGKNQDTSLADAVNDFTLGMETVYAHADYIAVNLSSPNTPGLRDLQQGDHLRTLLKTFDQLREQLQVTHNKYVPIAVKIDPDMSSDQLKDTLDILADSTIDAIIATNTTVDREAVASLPHSEQLGGLSGAPLRQKSTQCIAAIKAHLGNRLPVIGVGGIVDPQDAVEKIQAGASLVQCYTGFIYEGPRLIRESINQLKNHFKV